MRFHFVHPEQAQVPPGTFMCPDGVLALDNPDLTKLVKVEAYVKDENSATELARTSRWFPQAGGWVPLNRFQEWVTDTPSQGAPATEEAKNA